MKKLTLVKVPENCMNEYLDEFFNTSAFTFEGIDITNKQSNKELEKALRENGYTEDDILAYHYSGKDMNEKYNLTGDNRYPDDLTFLTIPKFYNPMFKMLAGARWFDDIVTNNLEREMEKAGVM
jgi:hypothetical protein